jgi:hypothetical protein
MILILNRKSKVGMTNKLHTNISNNERIEIIKDFLLTDICSAPGHKELRSPENILRISAFIKDGRNLLDQIPIILNIFTHKENGNVHIKNIECIDGNHRLVAFVHAGLHKLCNIWN